MLFFPNAFDELQNKCTVNLVSKLCYYQSKKCRKNGITEAKLYVPVLTMTTLNNAKLLE